MVACETGIAHFEPDFKNNVLTESNGMILCLGFKRNGKNAGENPPNAGFRSKPNGNVFKIRWM